MGAYGIGDKVVYAPHGAGIVVATTHRDDAFGEYLSIRIAQSNMTLMVPAALADEKGLRPVIGEERMIELLDSLQSEGSSLPDNPQQRARDGVERTRTGDATVLAQVLRDYSQLERNGKKLSTTELRTITNAKNMLASEIALVQEIPIAEAVERIEGALSVTSD